MSIGTPVSLGTASVISGSSVSLAGVSVAANTLVFVAVSTDSSAADAVTTVSDGTNTYNVIDKQSSTHGSVGTFYFFYTSSASGKTITANFTGALAGGAPAGLLSVSSVSGISTVTQLDKHGISVISTTTGPTVSTGVLTIANEIVFSVAFQDVNSTGTEASSGFANVNHIGAGSSVLYVDYQIVGSTTSVSSSPVWTGASGAADYGTAVASFEGTATQTPANLEWYVAFSQPSFGPVRISDHKTEMQAAIPPFVLQGIPWHKPWETPFFSTAVNIERHKTEMWPAEPIFVLQGIPWQRPWETPFFPTAVKVHLQKTEMWAAEQLFVLQGMPWQRPWEAPYFHGVNVYLQQTSMQVLSPVTQPAGVSGISWMVRWQEPLRPIFIPFETPPSLSPELLIYLAGDGIPLFYQGIPDKRQSYLWAGRGVQKQ